jgi:hypothetical protein
MSAVANTFGLSAKWPGDWGERGVRCSLSQLRVSEHSLAHLVGHFVEKRAEFDEVTDEVRDKEFQIRGFCGKL